jgi:hypothetical protein
MMIMEFPACRIPCRNRRRAGAPAGGGPIGTIAAEHAFAVPERLRHGVWMALETRAIVQG